MKTFSHLILVIAALTITSTASYSQNVGINTTGATPNASAILDLNTGNTYTSPNGKGALIPNVALASSTDAVTIALPATSLLVYVPAGSGLTPAGYYYNSGTPGSPVWTQLGVSGGGAAWLLTGNTGTNPTSNWIGTNDGAALQIKVDGSESGWIDYTGNVNTYYGYKSGNLPTSTGDQNVGIGYQVLSNNTSGFENTALGYQALLNNTGNDNVAIGRYALQANTSGTLNTATGVNALISNTTGSQNTATGRHALFYNTTGFGNTATGVGALLSNNVANYNVATGYAALYNSTGANNTANGALALYSNTTGVDNTASGYEALYSTTTGSFNTANGYGALYNNVTQNGITAIGYQALYYANNTAGGFTPGNTAVGYQALEGSSTPANNTGFENTALGSGALTAATSGQQNTATGAYALSTNSTGNYNTADGFFALANNNTGSNNVAVGYESLISGTTSFNTAVGSGALESSVNNENTALGYEAGYAGVALTTGSNDTYIGYEAAAHSSSENNIVVLGNTAVTTLYCAVTSITAISDARFKKNIKENIHGLDFITKLKPVSYNLDITKLNAFKKINDPDTKGILAAESVIHNGFLAQDVEKAAKECNYNFSGLDKPKNDHDTYGLGYTDFVVPLVKAVQDLNDSLKTKNEELQKEVNVLTDKLARLQLAQTKNEADKTKDEADIAYLKKTVNSLLYTKQTQASIK